MLRTFLMLGMITIVSCSSSSGIKDKQANIYFGAGTQSLMDGEYTAALTSLLKANELNPRNSEILTNLGMAYYFKGEKDLAIRHLEEALKIKSTNSDAKVNLASIYFKDKDYARAEKVYKEVLKDLTYDKQARTYYNLGLIELDVKKNSSEAEKYFKKSVSEDENYCPSYFQLGMIQYNRKQFNTALKSFKEAGTGTCYSSPAPHYYQGEALIKLGKFDEARMKFDDVETRFKKSVYSVKARTRAVELKSIETKSSGHAVRNKLLESPDF